MLNLDVIKSRLSLYGAAWLIGFAFSLIGILAAHWLFKADVIASADKVIPLGLIALSAALLLGVVLMLVSRESLPTKAIVLVLAALLLLPLVWAPVLGTVLAAKITHVTIEYSSAYASFRIAVAELLFPITKKLFSHALLETVWLVFQGVATVVGFLSALGQVWPMLKKMVAKPA